MYSILNKLLLYFFDIYDINVNNKSCILFILHECKVNLICYIDLLLNTICTIDLSDGI